MFNKFKKLFSKKNGGDNMSMFCYQCQEAAKGTGCTIQGVCGKDAELANLQDLLIYTLKGISVFSTKTKRDYEVDEFVFVGLFNTITNANFNKEVFYIQIKKGLELRDRMKKSCEDAGVKFENLPDAATFTVSTNKEIEAKSISEEVGVLATHNEDVRSLRELITYGLKGLAAYVEHAAVLGSKKDEIYAFMQEALAKSLDDSLTVDELVALTLETGKYGVEGMALLDAANTGTYGNPEMTEVNLGVGTKPGILISGHDLKDIEQLLEQTEGTGIDIYTHSEMLPAHYYPELKKYDHLVGNYGNAWWKQKEEFEAFNGPILFTTNCIGASGYPGWKHIVADENGKKDFSEIIEIAKKCEVPTEIETGFLK